MHELSIALSIIEGALEESENRGGVSVHAVHIRLGPLSGVDRDALDFSFTVAREGTPLESCSLIIHDVPVKITCAHCHATSSLLRPQRLRCPACDSPAENITGGRELEITAVEIDA